MAVCALTGCTAPGIELSMASADRSVMGAALESTGRAFFAGAPLADPEDTRDSGGLGLEDVTQAQPGQRRIESGVPLSGVGLTTRHQIWPGAALALRGALDMGRAEAFFPDGIGILGDPTRVRFTTETVRVGAGLDLDLTQSATPWRLHLGLERRDSRVRTQVDSALLDVEHRSRHNRVTGTLGLSGPLGRSAARWRVEAIAHEDTPATWRIGVATGAGR